MFQTPITSRYGAAERSIANRRPTESPRGAPRPDRIPVYALLRINHYFYKSREDLIEKTARGDAFYGAVRDFHRQLDGDDIANADEDDAILPIWHGILRASIGQTGQLESDDAETYSRFN